jgi:5'-methylthioinosine phosphorylase
MTILAIIGGSGLTALNGLKITRQQMQQTPYGQPSGPLTFGVFNDKEIVFLPRHGNPHIIPPHKINYRANIWALRENGIKNIIAINAVGGITPEMYPGRVVIPSQIIDYTWGRNHTYFDKDIDLVTHVDFSHPYSDSLRQCLVQAVKDTHIDCFNGGTYGATQGPRLESIAEIRRMETDGCDLVGMTGMPEAALAREQELDYASVCVVANWAAGKSDDIITLHVIEKNLQAGITSVCDLLKAVIPLV